MPVKYGDKPRVTLYIDVGAKVIFLFIYSVNIIIHLEFLKLDTKD